MELFSILIGFAFLTAIVVVFRLLGAWMLRIDEVIKILKEIRDELKLNNIK